jgi:hypothetical protein
MHVSQLGVKVVIGGVLTGCSQGFSRLTVGVWRAFGRFYHNLVVVVDWDVVGSGGLMRACGKRRTKKRPRWEWGFVIKMGKEVVH